MVRARRLYHINLNVSDIERSVHFYQHDFGVMEDFRAGPRMVFLNPEGADDVITLHQTEPVGPQGVAHFGFQHFGFQIEGGDLDSAIDAVVAAGGGSIRNFVFLEPVVNERSSRASDCMITF